jgi:hypothetical protein
LPENKSISRITAAYCHRDILVGKEWVRRCIEVDWSVGIVGSRNASVGRVGSLEKLDIGGKLLSSQIIHTFIESTVIGILDAIGGGIVPYNTLGTAREETEVDTFASIGDVLDAALGTGGFDPYTTSKSTESL